MARLTITGLKEIQRAYRELPRAVANKVVRPAIRAGLRPVKAEIELRAPKRSGHLAAKVKIRASKGRKRGVIAMEAGIANGDFPGLSFYGPFVDLGTKFQPGQGFTEKAGEASKDRAAAITTHQIQVGILRESKA